MSKTGWIILIVCLCLVFCLFTGLFLAKRIAAVLFPDQNGSRVEISDTKDYKDLKNAFSADGVYTVQMKDLKELSIDWISGSVTIEITDGDVVRIQEVSDRAIQEKNALRYGVSGGKLRIQACKRGYVGKLPEKELTVSLPRALADTLKDCEIDTVSAAISAEGLRLDELDIDTVSGRVTLQDMAADEAEFDTVSGDVTLRGCAFSTLRLDSVSGLASVTGAARKVKTSSVSGSIQLYLDDSTEIRVNTLSGHVVLSLSKVPKEVQVDTSSGHIDIDLPQDASCSIQLDSMSGKLLLNMQEIPSKQITLGQGTAEFDIDSMSGDVWVSTK